MKIMIGNHKYGYKNISNDFQYAQILDHYIKNTSCNYEELITEDNIKLAKRYLQKLDWKKYAEVACYAIPLSISLGLSFTGTSDMAYASDLINTQPLDDLLNNLYKLILKVGAYTLLPVLGWSGWTLLTSGTSPEKRTVAKNIIIYGCLGFLLIAGSPWLKDAIVHGATWVFSKH